jgi:hypothetical protein
LIRSHNLKASVSYKADLLICFKAKDDATKMSNLKEDRLVKCMFYLLLGKDFSDSNYHWKYLQSNVYGTAYDSYPSPENFIIVTTPIWIKYKLGKAFFSIIVITIFLAAIFEGFRRLKIRNAIQSKSSVVLKEIENSLDIAKNKIHNTYQPIKKEKVKKHDKYSLIVV